MGSSYGALVQRNCSLNGVNLRKTFNALCRVCCVLVLLIFLIGFDFLGG